MLASNSEVPVAEASVADDTLTRGRDRVNTPLSDLQDLSLTALRAEWRRLFRAPPPLLSRDLLMRGLAYRLQERQAGGLSRSTQRRLMALQASDNGEPVMVAAPRIKLGSRLVREWHGRTHVVTVTETGFDHDGVAYGSLTRIARHITGAHWSGPRFFGLAASGSARQKRRHA